jgi:hypothetical protein
MAADPVTFNAIGGLANRLRGIFSRYSPGMKVVWTRTWDIAGAHFLDVFEPVDGIEFIGHPGGHVDESCGASDSPENWHRHYALLQPIEPLRQRIEQACEKLGDYVAMHVRRTDHVKLAIVLGRYTKDEEFIAWAQTRPGKVFIATDNLETRWIMIRALPERFACQGNMVRSAATQHYSRRYNSLGDAVVDLFVCARAREFMGSAHSSFSELVVALRAHHSTAAAVSEHEAPVAAESRTE